MLRKSLWLWFLIAVTFVGGLLLGLEPNNAAIIPVIIMLYGAWLIFLWLLGWSLSTFFYPFHVVRSKIFNYETMSLKEFHEDWVDTFRNIFRGIEEEAISSNTNYEPSTQINYKPTGYEIWRHYGASPLKLGERLSQSAAIQLANQACRTGAIGAAYSVKEKSTGATIYNTHR